MLFGLFYLLTDLLSKHFLRLYSHCQFGNLERDRERWRNSDCPGGLSACFFFPLCTTSVCCLHGVSVYVRNHLCVCVCVRIPQYMAVCMYLCVALGCWFVLDRDPTESLCAEVFPAARSLCPLPLDPLSHSPHPLLLSSLHRRTSFHISSAFIVLMVVSLFFSLPQVPPHWLKRLHPEKQVLATWITFSKLSSDEVDYFVQRLSQVTSIVLSVRMLKCAEVGLTE